MRYVERLLLIGVMTVFALPAAAAPTFVVNSSDDVVDADVNDGICETGFVSGNPNGVCTLRAAIMQANHTPGGGAIVDLTMVPGGIVTITLPKVTDDERGGDFDITASVTIVGAGPGVTILDGNSPNIYDRVFQIGAGATVTMSGLTIRNGRVPGLCSLYSCYPGEPGGGIRNDGTLVLNNVSVINNISCSAPNCDGGGVYSSGTLTIVDSTVSGNYGVNGAGIAAAGSVTIVRSTVSNNAAVGYRGGGGDGGGIQATQPKVIDSTISRNFAARRGGGLFAPDGSSVVLRNSTISGNETNLDGGGIFAGSSTSIAAYSMTITNNYADADREGSGKGGGISTSGSFAFQNTILAGNYETTLSNSDWVPVGGDCSGTLTSNGFNIVSANTCTINGAAPIAADAKLAPLAISGGPTQTHALLAGSPALEGGDPAGCQDELGGVLAVDQRGISRPFGGRCDIGSFESHVCTYALSPVSAPAPNTAFATGLSVVTNDNSCEWTALSNVPWVSLTWGVNGSGSGSVGYQVDANDAAPRTGTITVADQTFTVTQAGRLAYAGDFNGDSRSDILWRHTSGAVTTWLMNGRTVTGGGDVAAVDPLWQIAGSGDFNGDGLVDILWRHSTSGVVTIWLMNGTQTLGGGEVATVDLAWQIVGVGDYDGDGRADILWRDSSGATTIWLMNGTQVIGGGPVAIVDPAWQIVGSADYNGDGRTDILWRDSTGATTIWFMKGTQVIGGDLVAIVDPEWQVAGSGDFNGDGRADILWRRTDGAVTIWLMNGTQVISGGLVDVVDIAWQVAGARDFNGDGRADILWRHSSGGVTIWLMDGTSVIGGGPVATVDPAWQIMPTR